MKKILKSAWLSLFLIPQTAFAAISLPKPIQPIESASLSSIVTNIINWILWLAGALVVIYLIYGGIVYITAAGNEEKVKAGKSILLNAIIGIVIILICLLVVGWIKGALTSGTPTRY
jgi:hypothetical protein